MSALIPVKAPPVLIYATFQIYNRHTYHLVSSLYAVHSHILHITNTASTNYYYFYYFQFLLTALFSMYSRLGYPLKVDGAGHLTL